jgi:hypothetical protein
LVHAVVAISVAVLVGFPIEVKVLADSVVFLTTEVEVLVVSAVVLVLGVEALVVVNTAIHQEDTRQTHI